MQYFYEASDDQAEETESILIPNQLMISNKQPYSNWP